MACNMFTKIEEAIKEAMKAHDNLKRDCLRSVVSEIKNASINAGKELTDAVCLKALQKSVKTHNDSIEQFTSAGRLDLVEKEKMELDAINSFLPKMMSEAEVEAIAKEVAKQVSEQLGQPLEKKDMGLMMKSISKHENAASIDMKMASKTFAKMLG